MKLILAALLAAALSVLTAGPASAHDPPPRKDDSTGCCFSFRDSPVVLCLTADACKFTAPPTGPR